MSNDKDLQKFLDAIDKIPSLPNIVVEVTRLSQDSDTNAQDIVDVVQYDQAITANCLKVANSAMFANRQKVSSLKEAVVFLGLKNLVKIVLASSAMDVFKVEQSGYGMRKGELWRHSVGTAIFSQLIAKKYKMKNESLLFTASLLHDIGKLALDGFVGEFSIDIMELMEQGYSEYKAETQVLGVDHARIGGLIAKRWQFPSELVNAIQNHHIVEDNKSIDFYVRVCNILTKLATGNHDGIITTLDAKILSKLNFTEEDLLSIVKEFPLEMKKASDLLNL